MYLSDNMATAARLTKRYVTPNTIIKHILANPFPTLDKRNLKQKLPLFSLRELLYRYLRCFAVHNMLFPFLTQVGDRYQPNHIITPDVLYKTAENILSRLEGECRLEARFPGELRQKRNT